MTWQVASIPHRQWHSAMLTRHDATSLAILAASFPAYNARKLPAYNARKLPAYNARKLPASIRNRGSAVFTLESIHHFSSPPTLLFQLTTNWTTLPLRFHSTWTTNISGPGSCRSLRTSSASTTRKEFFHKSRSTPIGGRCFHSSVSASPTNTDSTKPVGTISDHAESVQIIETIYGRKRIYDVPPANPDSNTESRSPPSTPQTLHQDDLIPKIKKSKGLTWRWEVETTKEGDSYSSRIDALTPRALRAWIRSTFLP
ncbi:hypothetical protein HDU76_012146, partial [Blyttiomyces sp. JEL0837]